MKRKNNKGFTLIEILAAVVILGIISCIAVPAVYKYVTKTKDFSYENMYKTVYDAVKNYRIDTNDNSVNGVAGPTYTKDDISNLVELNYLDPLIDPADKSKKCSAVVYVYNCADTNDTTVLVDHSYSVELTCSTYSKMKTFNDNGDLLTEAEYGACLAGVGTDGSDILGNFTVEDADLKYENRNGDNYDGSWTNKKIWIGNIQVNGLNSSDIDHFEYTTDYNNISINAKSESFGSNAKSYVFDGANDIKFRIRVVDKNGRVSLWSNKIFKVRIDQTSPEVTMQIINSSKNFTSPTYKGTATSNTYTYDGWVGGSGSSVPNVSISAKDDKSGINEELKVNYNTSGDFSNFNTKWNSVSGNKTFNSNNVFIANGLDDGFRVIKCTVTDKAGNKTTGTIKVKIDATAPAVTMEMINSSNNFSKVFSGINENDNNYTHSNWLKGKNSSTKPEAKISATDSASGVNNQLYVEYNKTSYADPTFKANWTANEDSGNKSFTGNSFTTGGISDGYRIIRVTVSDKAGNVTKSTIRVKIDTIAPKVTMAMVYGDNVSTAFTSKEFTGTGDSNIDEYSGWVKKNGTNDVKVMITAKDSGKLKDNLEVYYNNGGKYDSFSTTWYNTKDYTRTYTDKDKHTFTSSKIGDGYRVIKCVVKDEAGNTTEGIIKVKIDTKPPTIKLDLKSTSNSSILGSYSCSDSTCDKSYTNSATNNWVNQSVKDTVTFSDDDSSGTSSLMARYNEAEKSSENKAMTEWVTRKNDPSVTIKDGNRYIEYKATDVAGNTTELRFNLLKDTVPPKLEVTYAGNNKNDPTIFTANVDLGSEKSTLSYEHEPWINSNNDIVGESIVVSDALSGVKKDAKIKRTLYNSTSSYTQALKNKATTTDDWSYTSNYKLKITYSDTYLAEGYRVFQYQVKDKAGNVGTYNIKVKIDKTAPYANVRAISGNSVIMITTDSGETREYVEEKYSYGDTAYNVDSIKVHTKDTLSGVATYFKLGLNAKGKSKCSFDDSVTYKNYSYSEFVKSATNKLLREHGYRYIKGIADGCRRAVFIVKDQAGNSRTIQIKIKQNNKIPAIDEDINPDGCSYVEPRIRNLDFSWDADDKHKNLWSAYLIVCKEGNNYYAKKGYYYYKKGDIDEGYSPKLVCSRSHINATPGNYVDDQYKFLPYETKIIFLNKKGTYVYPEVTVNCDTDKHAICETYK